MHPIFKERSWTMRGKKLFSLLLVLVLALGALPLTTSSAAAAGAEEEFSLTDIQTQDSNNFTDGQTVSNTSISSDGVAEPAAIHGVYQISSVDDLLWAAGNPDKNYVLVSDIDLSGKADWTPIGTAVAPFSGSFNGAGHTITLGINQTISQNGIYLVGLFGYLSGTVANLTVGGTINASIYSGYVGSVAANIAGGSIINSTSNVDITVQGATGVVHVGGIAGSILNKGTPGGTIANSTNNGTINVTSPAKATNPGGDLGTGTNGSVGGILGFVTTFAKGVITTSVNNGDITVTNGSNNVGGIVGMTSSSNAATNADITYSANKGNVTIYNIAGERAAGIIGYIKSGRIDYSYNTGNVIAYADGGNTVKNGGNGYYFGILGYANTSNLEIIYAYNASPNPMAAEIGYAKNASSLKFQNFYMEDRSEYGASDPAGTPGTTFNSAADLLTKITAAEDGANAYTSNPEGGYPLLYFEKARTLADQDYDGIIEEESMGNDLNSIYYFVQTKGSVDTQGLTVNAALTKGSTPIENAALAALPSGGSVRVGDITYVAADGSTLYSVAMNSIPDNLWTEATITAQKDGQTVFTKTITNSNAATMPGGLPDYPDGTLSKTYNSGPGLANDQYSVTNEDSEMVVVSETSAETFHAYVQSLLLNGFEQISHTETDGNIYDSLKQGSQYFYLYYTAYSHQARIIQDNSTNTLLSDLDSQTVGSGSTEFYLYSIDYANGVGPVDPSKYCDCGALMIVKLADNSLFVIDGGHQNQSSEAAQYGLMKFMYKITGQPYGSKINIKAWFFSHAHGDHVYMAHAFVDAYHDNLNVESVLFNTPSFQTMRSGYDAGTFLMKQSFVTNFPNAKYVKLHTGQHFSLQGVGFDVLHTHEDAVNSSGVNTITDFNDTSTVFKLAMDGKTFLMLGDVNTLVQNDMLQMYSADTLRSDIVQVAHHGYNNLASLYDVVDASLAIVPNSEVGAKDNNPAVYSGYAKPGVPVLFADPDTYKLIVKDGNVEYTAIPSYREDTDLYNVTNVTLNIGSDQTQRNVDWYSDAPTAGKVQLALKSELTDGEFPTEHQEFAAVASDTNVTGFKTNKTTITGLAANSEYVYRVGTDDGWSPIYSFKTQSFTGDFSFLFAGDPQIGSSGNVANDTAGWTNTLNKSAAAFPQSSFLITAGDQVETADTETQYNGLLSPNVLKSLALAVDVGNHDVDSSAFSQHFNMPNVSPLGAVSSAGNGSGDYWYIYNNTLFMSINSNNLSAAEHSQFLQETLDAHGQDVKWKVVTFHHSIYSVANHALNDDILQRREDMAPVFSRFGIDVVFMGHDHVYTRSYMMNDRTPVIPEGDVPSSVTNPEAGQVLYITANSSSGSKHYEIQENVNFPYAAVKNQEHTANITKVDITDSSFKVTTYRVTDMSVVDTFTINRGTLQSQDAPTGLSGVAPTTIANADGKVTGVAVGMEYKLSSADAYTPVTGSEIIDLFPGTYQVRYAAKEGYHESQPVDVTVPAYEDMPVSNVDLTDLTVDGDTVSGFSADKTSYTVNVPYSKTSVTVAATAADETANVAIAGGNDLVVGDNTVTVTVTAEDGETKKEYSIIVHRAAAESNDGNGNGSGSGGGGLSTPTTPSGNTLPAGVGGTAQFANNAVTITVPAGASEKQLTITVQSVLNTSQLVTNDDVLLSPVYEILKNFTENFSKPVTITLTFDPDLVGTNQTASIFYYDEEAMKWVEIGGETSGERITAEVDHFTKFAVFAVDKKVDEIPDSEPEVPAEVTFSDIAGHWAETSIKQAAADGIIDGYTDGTFKPNGEVTRAEFAVMMARMLNLQGSGAALAFTDADTIGAWARQGIAQAVQAGIVKGYEDGSFRPNAQISRTEMAMMIANALGISNNTNSATPFADDAEIPAWAGAAVAAAVENGLIQGVGDNKFAPDKTATRAEAALILIRALPFANK